MSKYSKNLAGQKLKVFVSAATAYTDDTTFSAFIDNSAEGEIGIFLASGSTQTSALGDGDEFFIAQKRDGLINQTPIIKYDEIFRLAYSAYVAPVKQVSYIGYAETGSDTIGFNFTAASSTNTQTYQVSVRETTPGNQPFPVQEGYATVNSSTADQYTVLATIVSQLNGDFDYERTQPDKFVKAEITSNGAFVELTEDPTLINGSKTVTFAGVQTLATGSFLDFRGAVYKVAVGVTAGTSLTLDRPYTGASETIDVSATTNLAGTKAYTSGTTKLGVRLTAVEFESHFIASPFTGLTNDVVTNTTPWKLGSGSGTSIRALEEEGIIFDGVGSTVNAAFRSDYGYPTLFSATASTYNQFFIEVAPKVFPSAALPIYEQKQIERVIIAAPSTGTTPTTTIQTVLGL